MQRTGAMERQQAEILRLVRALRENRADHRFANQHLDELLRADELLARQESAELARPAFLRRAS